ncbi:GAK24 protein, partial [Phaetusa simplex]|nr:GAK24 protein [Phaetusa simplex]
LLKCFLEKWGIQGIDCKKELPGLLAFAVAKGFFVNPDTVFEQAEWRKYGDLLFDEIINDNKTARKLMKPWRAVAIALSQHRAEQKAAAAASERLGISAAISTTASTASQQGNTGPSPDFPLPPSVRTFTITQGATGGWSPTVPPPSPSPIEPLGTVTLSPQPTAPLLGEEHEDKDPVNSLSACEPPSEQESMNPFKNGVQMVQQRQKVWQKIAEEAMANGDRDFAAHIAHQMFPVIYSPPDPQGQITISITNLDWKLLTQLRATVNESGIKGEPTRQMLDYIWGTNILLPGDIRSIMRLILTQHQQLLFNAHWQSVCQESVAVVRGPGDPLHGVTLDELMGLGAYFRTEAQALIGPDKAKESMKLARQELDRIKSPEGIPSYMGIKQGREESFGLFIDRVANAIQTAGVPEYLKGAILKQCAMQNCNPQTRSILAILPGTWTIEEGLERMAQVPVGPQAMLVEAVKELGISIREQAQVTQNQVLAALAPLQTSAQRSTTRGPPRFKCFRCGIVRHLRRNCRAGEVWCKTCRSNTHNNSACRRSTFGTGNGRPSGPSRPATTQKAAA